MKFCLTLQTSTSHSFTYSVICSDTYKYGHHGSEFKSENVCSHPGSA